MHWKLISPNGKKCIKFDIEISTLNGMLCAMYVKQTQDEVANVATTGSNSKKQVQMSVEQAHKKLGHINERAMKEIATNFGWKLMDNQPLNCAACLLKKVSVPDPKDGVNGCRAYLYISMVKRNEKYPVPTNPNWRLIVVGTKLQLKFSHFFKMQDVMAEPMCELLH